MNNVEDSEPVNETLPAKTVSTNSDIISQRRLEKAAEKAEHQHKDLDGLSPITDGSAAGPSKLAFLPRDLIKLPPDKDVSNSCVKAGKKRQIKLMTWNVSVAAIIEKQRPHLKN